MKGKELKKLILFIIATIFILIYQMIASDIGSGVAELFQYRSIDPSNIFARVSVHHVVQMLMAILALLLVGKITHADTGLGRGDSKTGIRLTVLFTGVFLIYVILSYAIGYQFDTVGTYANELNTRNVVGTLGFQLLLSGISEEVLFRALPIAILLVINHRYKKTAVVVAALLFSVAHISFGSNPFSMNYNLFQLGYAFVLGICYGIVYIKSKSVLYPAIMHSISNFLMVGAGYLLQHFIQ